MRNVEILERAVEDAVGAENSFPSVTTNEITDPERDNDKLIEELFARAGVEGKKVRQRKAEKERKKCNESGDAQRAEEDRGVQRIFEELEILVERPIVNDGAVLRDPEGVGED
jgi:hypothetical protein